MREVSDEADTHKDSSDAKGSLNGHRHEMLEGFMCCVCCSDKVRVMITKVIDRLLY